MGEGWALNEEQREMVESALRPGRREDNLSRP
jgi:hypothetical protein